MNELDRARNTEVAEFFIKKMRGKYNPVAVLWMIHFLNRTDNYDRCMKILENENINQEDLVNLKSIYELIGGYHLNLPKGLVNEVGEYIKNCALKIASTIFTTSPPDRTPPSTTGYIE